MNDLQYYNIYLRGKIASLEKTIESYRSSKKFKELRHIHHLAIKEKNILTSFETGT